MAGVGPDGGMGAPADSPSGGRIPYPGAQPPVATDKAQPVATDDAAPPTIPKEYGWINKIPSLAKFIQDFIAEMETASYRKDDALVEIEFLERLSGQAWWTSHVEAYRENAKQRILDPATWEDNLETHKEDIRRLGIQIGFELTLDQIDDLARESKQHGGYTDDELTREILTVTDLGAVDTELETKYQQEDPFTGGLFNPSKMGSGTVSAQYDALLQLANDNWLTVNDTYKEKLKIWARDIIIGDMTIDEATNEIYNKISTGEVGGVLTPERIAELRNSGLTLEDEFSSQKEFVANIWELESSEVDNDWFKTNLSVSFGEDGEKTRLANRHDLKAAAYADPLYLKTKAYSDRSAGAMATLYRTFGAI